MTTPDELLAQAVAHHRAGRLAAAAVRYRRILSVSPDNADALHLLGLTERHAGRVAEGIALIIRALRINPALMDARVNLANLLQQAGRPAAAAAAWRQILAIDPAHARAWASLGALYRGQGGRASAQALAALGRSIRLDPHQAEILHEFGLALRHADRLKEAAASHRRALRLAPDFVAARMNLGNTLLELGDHDGAAASLAAAVALLPSDPACWFNLGNVRQARGDLEGALACYRRAARMNLGPARLQAGVTLARLGRLDEAEATLLDSLHRSGTDVSAVLEELSGLFIRRGRLAQGRALFSRLAATPINGVRPVGECLTGLAAMELQEGRPDAAAALLGRVQGDNGWFFTVKSLAFLRASLPDHGAWLARPPGDPSGTVGRVTSSTLAAKGRFAHTVMEYILVRLYAERHGLRFETPDWVGGTFFALDDPPQGAPLRPLLFPRRILNASLEDEGSGPPVVDRDLLSPLFLLDHREAYRARVQSWLRPRRDWLPHLEPAVEKLRALGGTVVAIHVRRGDFVTGNYPLTRTEWYVAWLRELWRQLDRPVLYLASDDLPAIGAAFAEFRPLTRADLAAEWPGLDYLQDFHVLTQADVVGVSAASGFSQLAARLNRRARIFAEPDLAARRIRPFVPWT
ncbi:MAG TPA: tetratricopeptide repeat protein [Azospirillaceae bacterium]|nr:tetratricopeptide repeat protein [Azospirillaceae bacterium]